MTNTLHCTNRYHRRSTRLRGYDYATKGAYFITICTRNRVCLLGDVTDGAMRRSRGGEIVHDIWTALPTHYPEMAVDAFVVMPNHVHGIVVLQDSGWRRLPEIVRGFKTFSARCVNESRCMTGVPVWQRNYHDRIIRDDDELNRIRQYIHENPRNWSIDHENLDFAKVGAGLKPAPMCLDWFPPYRTLAGCAPGYGLPIGNLRERLSQVEKRLVSKGPGGSLMLRSNSLEHDRLIAVLNSYLAHFARADAYRLTRSFWSRYRWLGFFVGLAGDKVVRRDRPRQCPRRLSRQYAWFARRSYGGVLFFQVGSHYELLNEQARSFGLRLCLRSIANRPGFAHRSGFHRKYLARYVEKVVKAGLFVTIVRESSRPREWIKERRIVARIMPKVRFRTENVKGAVS